MLTKFRKGADNIFVKILLIFVALSFVGIGASSFLGGNSRGDIIKFSKTDSIPVETFLTVKAKEIDYIQRQNNINLSEEQIKALNIDSQILQRLINDAMISYLGKLYDFEISDELVINYIKKMPYFKNEDGNFDLQLFKTAFRNSQKDEDEYLENLKTDLINTSLLGVFMESFQPSKIMVNNMINYMAGTKYFDVISIDLKNKQNALSLTPLEDKDLENFYNNNENNFIVPEHRSFDYITVEKELFVKKVTVEEKEIKDYYDANKNEFDDKSYSVVKKEVLEILQSTKAEDLINQISKNLEEDVAAGLTLEEIAAKYGVKISSVESITKDNLLADDKLNFSEIADSVFDMVESEASYPIEMLSQNKVILLELKKIIQSRKQEFDEVKGKISSMLQAKAIATENIKILEQAQKDYESKKVSLKSLKKKGIMVENNKSITRVDFITEESINRELMYSVFKTEKGHVTNLVRDDKKAYFAFVKYDEVDTTKAKKVKDTSLTQITNTIREGVLQELIGYLAEQNDVKVEM
ncbi:MAG: peptidylprolyl isomerase [Rickettsiaceae bacterium]